MESVLISARPKWCWKICHEIGKDENSKPIYEKRIEVRKTAPKEVPFKGYIYCSYGNDKENYMLGSRGKVVGEFICDEVKEFHEWELSPQGKFAEFEEEQLEKFLSATCLSIAEVVRYRENLPYYKPLYGWHISDLKIYDKPKELSEFIKACHYTDGSYCLGGKCEHYDDYSGKCCCVVKRPPQSWCYVEELK